MRKLFILLTLAFVFACGKKGNESKESEASKLDLLKEKRDFYLSLSSQAQDRYGFLTDTKCDGLLFTSLFVFGGGVADVYQAKDDDGKWFRHPSFDCVPPESKSSISRDMLLGLLFVLYADRNLKEIKSLIDYDDEHDGIMGDHDGSSDGQNRVTMTPILRATMFQLKEVAGGANNPFDKIPEPWNTPTGYQAHLEVLHILLRGMLYKGINDFSLEILESHARRQPSNALFQAVYHKFKDGNQNDAIEILLNEELFPSDRLPASKDRCTFYLFNHEKKASDWEPCPKEKQVFSGTDLIFAAKVILGD